MVFFKIGVLIIFEIFCWKTLVLESLFNKLYYKQTSTCSTQVFCSEKVFLPPFYRTPPVAASVFRKDFVDISYENSHTHTRGFYVAAAYLFLK